MSFEILGSRLLAPHFGGGVTVWACLIAVFLTALSAGNLAGGRAADWKPVHGLLAIIIALAAVTAAFVPLMYGTVFDWIAGKRFGLHVDPLLASASMFFLPAFFLGAITPFAIRILVPSVERAGMTAGNVYALSTAGSIFGTLFTAFYFIQTFGVKRVWFTWSALLLVMGAVLSIKPALETVKRRRTLSLAIPMLACLLAASFPADAAIVYERDTLYHHMVVEDTGDVRTLWFDAAPQSSMLLVDPFEGALEYTDYFHMPFVFNQNIRRVLFIGLGGGSGPKRFLYDYPDVQVDVVEIDPAVVEVAQEYFYVEDDPRLKIFVEDGRVFLSRSKERYDLIVVDAYLSSAYGPYIPFHLITREFFEEARDHLTVGGVLSYNVVGTILGLESEQVRSIYRTMSEVFPSLYLFPAETSMNVVFTAIKRKVNFTPEEVNLIGNRLFLERKVRIPAFGRRLMRCIAWAPFVGDVPVLTDDFAPIESLQAEGFATEQTGTGPTENEQQGQATPGADDTLEMPPVPVDPPGAGDTLQLPPVPVDPPGATPQPQRDNETARPSTVPRPPAP
jgi:spermidine synthase